MKKYLTITFFVLIAAYALFQARFLILGPKITIDSPRNDSTVDAGVLTVSGVARNVSFISVNDKQIYTDTEGRWQEKLIAQRGINIIKLRALDRFGRESERYVRVVAN
jgi:hypothetical protein